MNENSTGAMIAFRPEMPDDLTVAGGLPPEELHVTMVYLGPDHTVYSEDHRAMIGQVIRDLAVRIDAPITGVRSLGNDDPAATVLLLDSDDLQALRPALKSAMADAGVPVPEDTYPEFIPHITVGYGTSLDDAAALVGQRVTLATLGAWFGPDRDEVYANAIEEAPMAQWRGVLARIGVPTGDRRIIAPDSLTNRELPLPLMWQRTSDGGHMGSVVVGRITSLEYSDGMVTGSGDFLDVPETYEARELIRSGVIGPSIDLDDMDYVVDEDDTVVITQARIAGTTLVSIPAFADVSIHLTDQGDAYLDVEEYGLAASADPATAVAYEFPDTGPKPPLEWFARPAFTALTPLTVTPEGRVFGHVAPWEECHVGAPGCRTAPSSPSGYAYFLTACQATDAGVSLPVGTLTVGGGHALPELGFVAATAHYDDVGSAVAKVNCGEDEYGVWVAGWIPPWADPVKVEQFKTSPVSGDWRRIGGALELIAVCSVNTPGFPVARTKARVNFSMGSQRSLQLALGRPVEGEMIIVPDAASTLGVTMTEDQVRARWAWVNRKGR